MKPIPIGTLSVGTRFRCVIGERKEEHRGRVIVQGPTLTWITSDLFPGVKTIAKDYPVEIDES